MKRTNILTCLISAALSFMIGFGAVAAMITGFDLTIDSMETIALICAAFSLIGGVLCVYKHSLLFAVGAAAAGGATLLLAENAVEQCLSLVNYVSYIYDKVYGWGMLSLGSGQRLHIAFDIPMTILACLIALLATVAICRRQTLIPTIVAAILPLGASLVTIDTVPDVWSLMLLIVGLMLTLLSHTVRRRDAARGNLLTGMLALPTLIVIGMLFSAFPPEDYKNNPDEWRDRILQMLIPSFDTDDSTYGDLGSFKGYNAERIVDLSAIGPRHLHRATVLEVVVPKDGVYYLREQDYDVYDGLNWTASIDRADTLEAPAQCYEAAGEMTVTTLFDQKLQMLPYYSKTGILLAGGHVSAAGKDATTTWDIRLLPEDWRDRVAAMTVSPDAEPLVHAQRYTALPSATKAWATALVNDLLTTEQSATEIADTVAAYIRSSAKYDVATDYMPEGNTDFVKWFLEESDEGYCIHFASSTVVLLRAAGLQARYVVGYSFEATAGETTVVPASLYHAWAEYYEPRLQAWIPLDATPEIYRPSIPTTESTDDDSQESTEPSQNTTQITTATTAVAGITPAVTTPPSPDLYIALTVSGAALAIAAVPLQRVLRRHRRQALLRKLPPNGKALFLWQQVEVFDRLRKSPPPDTLKQLAEKAKFSQHTLTDEELQQFEDHLTVARAALRTHPWHRHLYYYFILAI